MGAIAASSPVRQIHVLPLRTLSDERLAELASAGQSDAFGTLYERYRDALARYCRSIVRDAEDAGDALQNTMVSVLRALPGHGPSGPVRPWLYRIAHNESVSIIRRRHPHEELSPDTPDRADTEIATLAKYRLDALLSDLRSLPENQRGALVMRELGGLEYAEIADALNLTPASARRHVFEARVALHDIAVGRETDCGEIMRRISDGDGRVMRARSVRGHLRGCPSCSAFERGMRTRSATLGLIPTLPLLGTGAVLAAVLHGGGSASTSVLAAGGSVAGGSIAAGSVAAAGSLLGGGSFAAMKGFAIAGAVAVAGAGAIVGTGIVHQARHSQHIARVVTHAPRSHRVHLATASAPPAPKLLKPPRLAVARAPTTPTPTTPAVTKMATPTQAVALVSYTPSKTHPIVSKPSSRAPVASVPVAVTTPTTASTPPAAPTTPTTTAGPTSAPISSPSTASTSWVDSIIEGALSTAGADVAAAESEAARELTQAGYSEASANSTVQGLITGILSGFLG